VSQIFDALIVAQDEVVERLSSWPVASAEEPNDGSSGRWKGSEFENDLEAVTNPARRLPGKVALSHKTIRNYLLLAFCATVLVLLAMNHVFRWTGPGRNKGVPIQGVAFEATVRPASEIRITAQSLGTVSSIVVKVGGTVKKGEPLLRLSDPEAELALKRAAADRDAAAANLDKFRARLAEANARVAVSQRQEQQVPSRQWRDSPSRAQAAYDQAQLNYNRALELYKIGVLAQQEVDARRTDLRLAQDDLENAKKLAAASARLNRDQADQAVLEAKVMREDLQEQLRLAEIKYQQARQQVDAATVRATEDGVISEIPVRLGDLVSGGTLLVRLAELNHMIAEVPVAARTVSELKVGERALITLPSSPPKQVEGRIGIIHPLPSANMTHTVEVQFDNPTLLLLAGQPAEVRFLN